MRWVYLAFAALLLVGSCSFRDRSACDEDEQCVYGDESGSDCINRRFGGYEERIYDAPGCVCRDGKCILAPCDNPPCYLG